MYISKIELRDWKAYQSADFDFPAPTNDANIVLIGAPNGSGKTSLYEAIVLGVFGQDGMHLIASSPLSGNDNKPLTTSYKKFLERSLHRGAISTGRNLCSVKIVFVDNEKVVEIQRIWHFNGSGIYRAQDEVVQIFEGAERKAIGPETHQQDERIEWYRDYIARTFLPRYLATFFLFDGEHVSAFAEREMAGQVRTGIEGLLGVPVLRELASDLRKYAIYQRQKAPTISDETIDTLEKERDKLNDELNKLLKRLETIIPELSKNKEDRSNLLNELASFGGASQAQVKEQIAQMHKCETAIADGNKELEYLLSRDIALALAGMPLRKKLKTRLQGEHALEKWEAVKQQGTKGMQNFLNAVAQGMKKVEPNLSDFQQEQIIEVARCALHRIWHPPPKNCAESYQHAYLSGNERNKVIDSLNELDALGSSKIVALLNLIADNEKEQKRLQVSISRIEAVAPTLETKHKDLKKLNTKIEAYTEEDGALRRERVALDSRISNKNTELTKLYSQRDLAKRPGRLANHAIAVANMVDAIVKSAVPNQIKEIAKAMTDAHRSMAHMNSIVHRIEIDEECNVKLMSETGIDIRDHDLSAGQKQIFTQALISAVSSVSKRAFPMVVDTPLGKLDVEHRKGVLNHLTKRGHQVILLSTDTEVVGDYLQEISPHVQTKYLIHCEEASEIGRSIVVQGYFESEGATR